jgi:hypothetical protein
VTTLEEEFESALKLIGSAPLGQEVLQSLSSVAKSLTQPVFGVPEGKLTVSPLSQILSGLNGPAGQLILGFLGREGVQQILHKNCVLAFGRILNVVRAYDTQSPTERLVPLIDLLSAIAPQAQAWARHHEAVAQPVHDKKERLKRRHAMLHEEQTHTHKATCALLESLWSRLIPILLPHGAASLYLPEGGSLLLPHIDKGLCNPTFLHSPSEQAEKFIRDAKVSVMCWLLGALRQWLGSEKPEPPNYDIPRELAASIEPLVAQLRTAFVPIELAPETSISPATVAPLIARTLLLLVQSTSLESLLMTGWLNICRSSESVPHTEGELETQIEALSHDERLIKTVLHRTAPTIDIGGPHTKDLTGSFWGMLMHGLTSSMTDVLIEDTLSSFDWESAQRMVLDRFRWFLFSPYADGAVASWIAHGRCQQSS